MEILKGYRPRTGGEVRVLGHDPVLAGAARRARIGVVLQESEPERELTVLDHVGLHAPGGGPGPNRGAADWPHTCPTTRQQH